MKEFIITCDVCGESISNTNENTTIVFSGLGLPSAIENTKDGEVPCLINGKSLTDVCNTCAAAILDEVNKLNK